MKSSHWYALKDVAEDYGLTVDSARQSVRDGRFPVPTYKVGKLIVIDRAVHETYFRQKREEGLRVLNLNKQLTGRRAE